MALTPSIQTPTPGPYDNLKLLDDEAYAKKYGIEARPVGNAPTVDKSAPDPYASLIAQIFGPLSRMENQVTMNDVFGNMPPETMSGVNEYSTLNKLLNAIGMKKEDADALYALLGGYNG